MVTVRVYLLPSLSLWDFLVQASPPQSGSELGSVEDAADYHLRQQLRAAAAAALAVAAELKACQEERDRAIAAAAEAILERNRAVAGASRNADKMEAMRLKIRANAAAERRRIMQLDRPKRGVFDLAPDYAVPLNIGQRGAHETQVMSTDSISKEGRPRPRLTSEHLRDRVHKKARLLGAADTRLQYDTTKRRTNAKGSFIGGVEFSARNKVEAFRRFSAPGFKSHATVGSARDCTRHSSNGCYFGHGAVSWVGPEQDSQDSRLEEPDTNQRRGCQQPPDGLQRHSCGAASSGEKDCSRQSC